MITKIKSWWDYWFKKEPKDLSAFRDLDVRSIVTSSALKDADVKPDPALICISDGPVQAPAPIPGNRVRDFLWGWGTVQEDGSIVYDNPPTKRTIEMKHGELPVYFSKIITPQFASSRFDRLIGPLRRRWRRWRLGLPKPR